jgi:hypothetical protein
MAVLDAWCEKVGRDPAAVERSVGLNLGSLDRIDEYAAAGVTEVTLGLDGPNYDMAPLRRLVAWRDQR